MVALLDILECRSLLLASRPWGAISCAWGLFPWGLGDPPLCTADPVSAMPLLTKQWSCALCPLAQAQGLAACNVR